MRYKLKRIKLEKKRKKIKLGEGNRQHTGRVWTGKNSLKETFDPTPHCQASKAPRVPGISPYLQTHSHSLLKGTGLIREQGLEEIRVTATNSHLYGLLLLSKSSGASLLPNPTGTSPFYFAPCLTDHTSAFFNFLLGLEIPPSLILLLPFGYFCHPLSQQTFSEHHLYVKNFVRGYEFRSI